MSSNFIVTIESKNNCFMLHLIFTLKMKFMINFIVALCFHQSLFNPATASELDIDDGEVVQLQSSRHHVRREVRPVTFEVDGEDYSFNFEPTNRQVYSHDVPVWLVKSQPGSSPNYTYERVPYVLSHGNFYVDNAKKAVAFVHYDKNTGDILYDGVFGENENLHLIRSLSETQKRTLQRSQRKGNHVVRRISRSKSHLLSGKEEEKERGRRSVDLSNENLDKPLDILYPKLLILVDYNLFKYFNNDIAATIQYVATFWNKVDQKYTELDSVDVRLLVTGIIIANDEKAFNYVYQSRIKSEDSDRKVDPYKMYDRMRMYFHHNFSSDVNFQNYDATVMMTALDTNTLAGLSYMGKICGDWSNAILLKDEGWFAGTQTAAHELAHALGSRHDSLKTSGDCQPTDGNKGISVMAPVYLGGDYFFWSDCTKKDLEKFTTVKAAECLATRSRERHYDAGNTW